MMTDDCKGFDIVTFAAFVIDAVFVDETAVVFSYCELVVVLGFDAVATYVVDVLDTRVVVVCHLAVYLAVVSVLNLLDGIEVHFDIALLVLPVLQEVSTKLYI